MTRKPVPATRARKARKVVLTPGQKAARTKRLNGLDLSAVALKAVATRRANVRKAAKLAKAAKAARAAKFAKTTNWRDAVKVAPNGAHVIA